MQKIAATIMLLLLFNSSTELHQLFRVPVLLEHYRQHSKKDPSLSLLGFLKIHYTGAHPDDNDESSDQDLPFKSVDNICHTDGPFLVRKHLPAKPVIVIQRKLHIYHNDPIPDKSVGSIFHPPRVVSFC